MKQDLMISFLDEEFQAQKFSTSYYEVLEIENFLFSTQMNQFLLAQERLGLRLSDSEFCAGPHYIKHLPWWWSSRGRKDMKVGTEGLIPFISDSLLFGSLASLWTRPCGSEHLMCMMS